MGVLAPNPESDSLERRADTDHKHLLNELEGLRREVARLRASEQKHERVQQALQKRTHALGERVKELNCLYAMSSLVERHKGSLEGILEGTVEIIPSAWQYPEIAAARITVGAHTYATSNYRETPWRQSADIHVKGVKEGTLDVVYLEERPECGEGPFLKEERSLINSMAKGIGETVERAAAEDALKESVTRNKALLNAIPDLIFRVHKDGTILDFKKGKTLGRRISPARILGKKIMELPDEYPYLSRDVIRQGFQNARHVLETGETQIFEHRFSRGDSVYNYEVLLTVSGKDEVLGIIRDITERRRLEKQVLEVSEWEQQRIGQDLHDSLSQQLAGIAYLSKVLEQKMATKSLREAFDAAEIVSLINEAITQTKGLARGLYPVRLEAGGLMNALSELATNVERLFGISCRFEYDRPVFVSDSITAIHLYRIAQEAVNNAIKHGQAKNIVIDLNTENETTVLTIRNDGLAFRRGDPLRKGMGLSIMKHRASMIGASFDIRNDPDGGTVVACSFQGKQGDERKEKER
ncbi:MAG: Oxygen sensor histidine kinase NreB [Syntrophorhabdus sp. PtaU1.Bin153]|nr:MAG: Oxygen sensor histidine kinase NreB [Syntrophorhabdus sp. PtaU1.Bin153]